MNVSRVQTLIVLLTSLSLFACDANREKPNVKARMITVATVRSKPVTITQQYVCQVQSFRRIDVRALESGNLKAPPVREGQAVKEGELLFEIAPVRQQARREAAVAERNLAQLELNRVVGLADKQVVSMDEVKLSEAKLAKAQAIVDLAEVALSFTKVKAPFDGIIDRLIQSVSRVQEGDILGTLSDNSLMWALFDFPQADYFEHMTDLGQLREGLHVELILSNGKKFGHAGKLGPIVGDFNSETGTISCRAEFPNPDRLLRHGQSGTVLLIRELNDAIVIPQRATLEVLDKRYVYVVDQDNVAHQREIVIQNELEDLFVIKKGVRVGDKIVLEDVRMVRDGDKVK